MTVTPPPEPDDGSTTSRVTVVFPDGREHIWVNRASPIAAWEVGQVVIFRNNQWRVVARRAEETEAVTLTLGPL